MARTGRGWLIDPAAHGGHRETDLAMLALFGAPELAEKMVAGYTETVPLADGWRDRVALHQLHPLLVHVCLFGGGYTAQLTAGARGPPWPPELVWGRKGPGTAAMPGACPRGGCPDRQ